MLGIPYRLARLSKLLVIMLSLLFVEVEFVVPLMITEAEDERVQRGLLRTHHQIILQIHGRCTGPYLVFGSFLKLHSAHQRRALPAFLRRLDSKTL